MVKKITIKKLNITLVLRHRFEKDKSPIKSLSFFNKWRLGFWCKKQKIMASAKSQTNSKKFLWVNDYMFGIDLLIASAWVSVDLGGLHFDYDFIGSTDRDEK